MTVKTVNFRSCARTALLTLAALASAAPACLLAAKGDGGNGASKTAPSIAVALEADLRTNSPGTATNSPVAELFQTDSVAAVSGDTAAVVVTRGRRVLGAFVPPFSKEVYVYQRNSGAWTVQAVLVAADPAEGSAFGSSLALSGDTLVVGVGNPAPATLDGRTPANPASVRGSHVFQRVGGSWVQQARLVGVDALVSSYNHGSRVAISGSTIVVGAAGGERSTCVLPAGGCTTFERRAGRLFVFDRNALGQWVQTAALTVQSPHGALFAFDGRTLAVPEFETVVQGGTLFTGTFIGHVAMWERSGTAWLRQARLTSADQITPAQLADPLNVPATLHGLFVAGESFTGPALRGDTLLVPGGDVNIIGGRSGIKAALYVFQRTAGVWAAQGRLVPKSAVEGDGFGRSLAFSGNAVLSNYKAGARKVTLFSRTGTTWAESTIGTPGTVVGNSFDFFGEAVALDGATALVTQPSSRMLVHRLTPAP